LCLRALFEVSAVPILAAKTDSNTGRQTEHKLKRKLAVSIAKALSQIHPSTLDTIGMAPITYWAANQSSVNV
jgi:hypothetical protein